MCASSHGFFLLEEWAQVVKSRRDSEQRQLLEPWPH